MDKRVDEEGERGKEQVLGKDVDLFQEFPERKPSEDVHYIAGGMGLELRDLC